MAASASYGCILGRTTACGRAIAKEAAACPGCGAPNRWLHPEIVRFLHRLRRFRRMPHFDVQHEKYVLVGIDRQSRQNAEAVTGLVNSLGVITPMNLNGVLTIAGAHFGRQWVNQWAGKRVKAFRVDFSTVPPSWWTTDDDYWADVLDFFGF